MTTYYIVKRIGTSVPALITPEHAEAAEAVQRLNHPAPAGYVLFPSTEQGLKDLKAGYVKRISDLQNAIEDIEAVLPVEVK